MKCEVCRGACCESILLPYPVFEQKTTVPDVLTADANKWFALHGRFALDGKCVELEARCTKLTDAGRCGIYTDRPLTCQLFEASGPGCMRTVKERRSPEEYALIRDPNDPVTIHEFTT